MVKRKGIKDMEDMTDDELIVYLKACGLESIHKCEPGEEPGLHLTGIEEPGDWAEWGFGPPEGAPKTVEDAKVSGK
jgi:hypothetical protein